MLSFLITLITFFLLLWFTIDPGSRLGVAFTSGDFARVLGDLNRKELQTRHKLRVASHKAMVFYSSLLILGTLLGVSSGTYTLDTLPALLGSACGLALAYIFLLWSTRPDGWYGEA